MSSAAPKLPPASFYPDSDGNPVAETPEHRDNLLNLIYSLRGWYADDPTVYVSGNMFLYYVPGNRRQHVSPDVFVTFGIGATRRRRYLVWEEGKGPDAVIEITSPSTRDEDLEDKFDLYRDTLKVKEYFLFDPFEEYLNPSLQGFRLRNGRYARIRPVRGRIPSELLGLHLVRQGWELRLYDPATKELIPNPEADRLGRKQEAAARRRAEAAREKESAARQQAEAEVERLRRELDALRQRSPKQP